MKLVGRNKFGVDLDGCGDAGDEGVTVCHDGEDGDNDEGKSDEETFHWWVRQLRWASSPRVSGGADSWGEALCWYEMDRWPMGDGLG